MITNIKEFCGLFHDTTLIPITCYNSTDNSLYAFPKLLESSDIFKNTLPNFGLLTKNPDYFIADSFTYFGYIAPETNDYLIIIGPIISTPASNTTIRNFMKEWGISSVHREDISMFLKNLPQFSFNRFLQVLAYLHFCINDKNINISEHFELTKTKNEHTLSTIHTNQLFESKEQGRFHNTYQFEKELLEYVGNGEIEHLKKLLSTSAHLSEGVLADNSLRQEKNIFISTVALVTRAVIAGGMDMEQAYQLSDIYIQECENSQNLAYVVNLNQTMLIDFTERVAKCKVPQDMSPELFECIHFISCHTNEPIQVGDVAKHIGRSRSYLTAKFKHELGFDISSFIMRCKLEEAKSLLTYSEKSLSEISNYLCFSSQAYFQNVFKKKYNITPKQYRINTRQI